jgi:hypothetical protein
MSDILDISSCTGTTLPKDFTCSILILGPNLTHLPNSFLRGNKCVKTLNMSKCINIYEIPRNFCMHSYIEYIIWPPNIKYIQDNCLRNNKYTREINLSYCNNLEKIGECFGYNTNIINVILPSCIEHIDEEFMYWSKIKNLEISHCLHLKYIGSLFCGRNPVKYIEFPRFLENISGLICDDTGMQELNFGECRNIKIDTSGMNIETLRIYNIDNITKDNFYCKNLYIQNSFNLEHVDLSFILNLQKVYLPEGEYQFNKTKKHIEHTERTLLKLPETYELKQFYYEPKCPICLQDTDMLHVKVFSDCKHMICIDCYCKYSKNDCKHPECLTKYTNLKCPFRCKSTSQGMENSFI